MFDPYQKYSNQNTPWVYVCVFSLLFFFNLTYALQQLFQTTFQ